MNFTRRRFLHLAGRTAALPVLSGTARAQSYPLRPVRIIVGFPAGGGVDIVARLLGQAMSERLGQPVVIDNRPGANSNIATEAAVRAAPDGHTLLIVDSSPAINATLYDKLNFNFVRDIAPVAIVAKNVLVMVVNPSVPATTVPEFIAYVKANPGKVNMGSAGIGNGTHIFGELFKSMSGVNMVHVPYRGAAPALADLLGGQVQVLFLALSVTLDHIKAGKLRALAVTNATRWQGLPDIPAVGEFLPGYEATNWYGVGAPRRTPIEIVDKLNREINVVLADAKMKARLADLGAVAIAGAPADFGKLIAEETEKWGKVIRAANIKLD
jgi:tripartite-type tricarboxylate transporter receptor subunit TctC